MKKKVRIFITWIVISLLIQFAIYSFLDSKIAKVLAPPSNAPITASLTAQIPGTGLENPQLSYDKKYLAYMENGIFKVFSKAPRLISTRPHRAPKTARVASSRVDNFMAGLRLCCR